jgi:hypothetical protein
VADRSRWLSLLDQVGEAATAAALLALLWFGMRFPLWPWPEAFRAEVGDLPAITFAPEESRR